MVKRDIRVSKKRFLVKARITELRLSQPVIRTIATMLSVEIVQ